MAEWVKCLPCGQAQGPDLSTHINSDAAQPACDCSTESSETALLLSHSNSKPASTGDLVPMGWADAQGIRVLSTQARAPAVESPHPRLLAREVQERDREPWKLPAQAAQPEL